MKRSNSRRFWQPSELLRVLGIEEPEQINLWAIAELCGAQVRKKPLGGCEANLVGYHEQAIITINKNSPVPRQRFSVAHELGHWQLHRGQSFFQCQAEDLSNLGGMGFDPEREANLFATELLMPEFMCRALMHDPYPNFQLALALSGRFHVSVVAMCLRLIELYPLPAMLYMSNGPDRLWCRSNRHVPVQLRLPRTLTPQILQCHDYCQRIVACKTQWLQGTKKFLPDHVTLWQESHSRGPRRLTILTLEGME